MNVFQNMLSKQNILSNLLIRKFVHKIMISKLRSPSNFTVNSLQLLSEEGASHAFKTWTVACKPAKGRLETPD